MDYMGILTIAAINIGLIAWIRSDLKGFEAEVRRWREDIHTEMKDFHGRLCSIESRYQRKDKK